MTVGDFQTIERQRWFALAIDLESGLPQGEKPIVVNSAPTDLLSERN